MPLPASSVLPMISWDVVMGDLISDRPMGRCASTGWRWPASLPASALRERTFECSTCGRTKKISIEVDPVKSDAVRWLAGELRPYLYASRTRVIPEKLLDLFERTAWPVWCQQAKQ